MRREDDVGGLPPCQSFILIHPALWPQYTNVRDRTEGTDRTTVPQHGANRFINGRPKIVIIFFSNIITMKRL